MISKIPDKVMTYSMSEAVELHLAVFEEEHGFKIKLSDKARKTLIEGLTNQDITMKRYGYDEEPRKDSLTAAIYSFLSGYIIGRAE